MSNDKDASESKSFKQKVESLEPPELDEADLESISGGFLINKDQTGTPAPTPKPDSKGVMAPGTSC
jgi:hypothetical protein